MIQIEAIRDRPTSPRLEQIAGVFERFNIIPDQTAGAPGAGRFNWQNDRGGHVITLTIRLADDAQATGLIRELRMCGFVANVQTTQ